MAAFREIFQARLLYESVCCVREFIIFFFLGYYLQYMLRLYPTTNGGAQKGSSVGICTRCIHVFFACLAPICHAQSVLVDKVSASELSRKLIRSALLVGQHF